MKIIKENQKIFNQLQNVIDNNKLDNEVDVNNKLELLKYSTQIQSRIKKHISSDFVLAKLTPEDKKGIINMVSNAYMCKRLILNQINKIRNWEWDKNKKQWIKTTIKNYPNKEKYLKEIANTIFDTIMVEVDLTAILNRNVPKNYLLRILSGFEEEMIEGNEMKEKIAEKVEGKTE